MADQTTHYGPEILILFRKSHFIKVRKSRKQFMVSLIPPKNEQKITFLSIFSLGNTQDSDFLFASWES